MQKLYMLLLLLVIGGYNLQAQQDQRLAATKTPISEVERLYLPALDNKELLETELSLREPGRAPHFAESITVDVSTASHGNWETHNGKATWRLRVPSAGAKSLNFGFDQFFMPEGGSLIIYTPDLSIIRGPFTPADNEEHEELWTPIIPSDELVIEVSLPLEQKEQLRLHLKSINHDYMGFAESALSGSCNIDVVCALADGFGIVDQYRDIIQSVAVYSTGGTTFCTGFLVTTTREDCTPFFMTANHCGINAGNAASLVTYWNFNNSVCRQPGTAASGGAGDGQLNDFNTGSIHRASYSPTDVTLVELDDPVSETADAWYAGWDATDNLEQDTLIGIHHPSTDEKRISFQFEGVYRGNWGTDELPVPDGNHIVVEDWNMGTTEGGSSGSPIFDSNKRVVGQLHGGFASCNNELYDTYGWFHDSWIGGGTPATRLSDWLDPDNTGALVTDGRNFVQCSYFAGATPAMQSICASETVSYEISATESFIGPVSLSLEGLPSDLTAIFETTTIMPGGTTNLTISSSADLPTGAYSFNLLGSDGENSSSQNLTINITNGLPSIASLSLPIDMASGQVSSTTLIWQAVESATSYDIEVATDENFTNIIITETGLATTEYATSMLEPMSTFYWRVIAHNLCGIGEWTIPFSFETGTTACSAQQATDLPMDVGPSNGSTTVSTIEVNAIGAVASLSIIDLDIEHTWVGDLSGTLTSPEGTTIDLFNTPDCNQANLLVNFEDDTELTATNFENTCEDAIPAIQGTFQPADPFSTFVGEQIAGTWTLTITDNANADGGQLNGWGLDFCSVLPGDASISATIQNSSICIGNSVAFSVALGSGFENDINLSTSGLPAGATVDFETNPATPGSILSATINNIAELGTFNILVTADDGVNTSESSFDLTISGAPDFTALQTPIDQAEVFTEIVDFSWDDVDNSSTYLLEVATDDVFTNLVLDIDLTEVNSTSLNLLELGLEPGQQFYWRVTAINECGESVSSFNSFQFLFVGTQEIGEAIFDIHPNPTYGPLQITITGDLGLGANDIKIDVFATNGQRMSSWNLPTITGTQTLDLSHLPSGVYWLNITNGKLHATEKIVLVK